MKFSLTGTTPAWLALTTLAAVLPTATPAQTRDPAAQARWLATGERVFRANCAACHDNPLVLAPQIRNQRHWARLMRQHTREEFYEDTIEGEGDMPARGGDPKLTDDELKAAVDYMLDVAVPRAPRR